MLPATLLGASNPPAGGAATSDVIYATAGAMVVTVLLLGPVLLYKLGRFPALGRLADLAERVTKLPGWAALPGTFLAVTLLIAVFGMYWDISLHIDQGRDPGPLANPAHYFILAGLFGVLLAGVIGLALPKRPTRTSYEIAPGWYAPIGALMIAICGASSLLAFPLDDIWHRIFGQDVTLWGPTHLMLIGGASLSVLGAWALHAEGDEERRAAGRPLPRWTRFREIVLAGAFLVALSTFQAEFDFGVPQFALALQPDADHAGRRDRPGHGADPLRARRRGGGARCLHRDPRHPHPADRPALRRDHPPLPALRGGGARGRGRRPRLPARRARRRAADHLRRARRARDRHGRPRRRVALVPRLGRQPLARLPLPRGRDHRPDRRGRRRRDRWLHRPRADPGGAAP